jgi:uncharacterized protein (TIGR03435 family)
VTHYSITNSLTRQAESDTGSVVTWRSVWRTEKRLTMRLVPGFMLALGCCAAQIAPAPPLEFEVASVKHADPSSRPRLSGVPGSNNPGQNAYISQPLSTILSIAFGMPEDQISGPGWLGTEQYDIIAKIPLGATKEQFQRMLQTLLTQRFALAAHHEPKNISAYEMTVARGGLKLRTPEADTGAQTVPDPSGPPGQVVLDSEGNPRLPPGRPGIVAFILKDGRIRVSARMKAPADLIPTILRPMVGRTVVDRTGATGQYDFDFDFKVTHTPPPSSTGPGGAELPPLEAVDPPGIGDLTLALEKLGLKLEAKRTAIDVLIIDQVERNPTEN